MLWSSAQTPDGTIITGHNSNFDRCFSVMLNAIKHMAEIPDKIHLISSNVIEHIKTFKSDYLELKNKTLDLEETLIALSISTANNPTVEIAIEKLKDLKGCEVHLTHIPTPGDEIGLRRLKVNLTADTNFPSRTSLGSRVVKIYASLFCPAIRRKINTPVYFLPTGHK